MVSIMSSDDTVTEKTIYASLYVLQRFIPLMQLLNWDEFQFELSEDGAVELPCTFGTELSPLLFCREGGGRDNSQIANGTKNLIPFTSGCCRQRPEKRVKRSWHHSSPAGCLSVEAGARKGNNHKSSLVWAVINF